MRNEKRDKERRKQRRGQSADAARCKNERSEIKGEARGKRGEEEVAMLMGRPVKYERREEAQQIEMNT